MQVEMIPGVKSRPVYTPVTVNPRSQRQIFIAQDQIPAALQSLYDGCEQGEKSLLTVVTTGAAADGALSADDLVQRVASLPQSSSFYLAGSEAFMWDIAKLLTDAGFISDQIAMLAPLSKERRLFCTHCYTLMDHVTHSPHVCSGCGRALLVRDHFSKIHRAYVGVQINAEDPADLPAAAEELS